MRLLTLIFTVFIVILSTAVSVNSFNVPPTGMCYVKSGKSCMRCDCEKPSKCYKGVCR
ncbi:hypothetical protein ANCCEY_10080 [Ancylostoma ceylanicum]|uniref:Pacifastin domain-containing protein n=1 Tax=Ancylostoma ceylanicum TaxID=53326 RepID=A0A0D6LLF7_9BILA|nr:hypothetical protein ANCCEY_10080 [Ancylostoma ceylanicum]